MEKGKEPVIYISDDETTTDHSEEEVELNNGEMMNAPEDKDKYDAVKLAELKAAKRRQANRASAKRSQVKKSKYFTDLKNEEQKLKNDNSNTTKRIKLYEHTCERLQFENRMWSTRLQSLNERYMQSLEENGRLQQECIDLENLQQEQSRDPNAAQDPNSMLEPRQIQTSGTSYQHAHQLGGHHNAAYPSYGIMVPQQILTSGPFDQQAHQPVGPHNAAYHSSSIMVPQQILTSGPFDQQAHQPVGPHNASYHSSGIMVPQQILTSGPFDQQAHQPVGPHNAAYHSYGIMLPQQILTSGPFDQQAHQPVGPHNVAYHSSGIMVPQQIQTSRLSHQPGGSHNAAHHSYGMLDINDITNGVQEPNKMELGQSSASQNITTEEWVESCINDFDQNVLAPQLSADDSVLGWEMPSTAQLQEGMSSTDVEKATSDAGQIE